MSSYAVYLYSVLAKIITEKALGHPGNSSLVHKVPSVKVCTRLAVLSGAALGQCVHGLDYIISTERRGNNTAP